MLVLIFVKLKRYFIIYWQLLAFTHSSEMACPWRTYPALTFFLLSMTLMPLILRFGSRITSKNPGLEITRLMFGRAEPGLWVTVEDNVNNSSSRLRTAMFCCWRSVFCRTSTCRIIRGWWLYWRRVRRWRIWWNYHRRRSWSAGSTTICRGQTVAVESPTSRRTSRTLSRTSIYCIRLLHQTSASQRCLNMYVRL